MGFDASRALASWAEHDRARAIHAEDSAAIDATEPARAWVLAHLADEKPRELYNACARLGRLLADVGASPSFATTALDGAVAAAAAEGAPALDDRVAVARASLAEGYCAAIRELEREDAKAAWEYPACAVRLDESTAAFVAGYPSDDGEALANWAGRVASRASRDGVKRAVVKEADRATRELESALRFMGIEVRKERSEERSGGSESKSQAKKSWWPWSR